MRMKRNFTGPVWLLLVAGILMLLAVSIELRIISVNSRDPNSRRGLPVAGLLRIYMWPMVLLLEALVYWLIRRRNKFRALSWTHSVIFVASFLISIFIFFIELSDYRVGSGAEVRVNRQILMHEQVYFFWGLVVLAHVAFVAVLANCLRKQAPAIENEGQGQENLLDDVVL